jgi:ABC-type nitrate/sulfonate/bicarbonate transport system permease component
MPNNAPGRWLEYAAPVLVAIVTLALWQGLVDFYEVPPWLVPSPARVLATLVTTATCCWARWA